MLKRFMTWLLRKLQGLMGALNGKRSSSQPPEQGLRDNLDQSSQQRDRPKLIDTSRSTVSLVDHLSDKPAAKPNNGPVNDLPDAATLLEPDTHRRLDAAAAAPPAVETVTPSFPTTVSELIDTPIQADDLLLQPDHLQESDNLQADESFSQKDAQPTPTAEENITLATSVRSLKKVSNDQLPSIHDVLPAEPASTEASVDISTETKAEAEAEAESVDDAIANPAEPASPPEQAVLFSFDITERAADLRGDEPLAEELSAIEPAVDEPATSGVVTGKILIEVPSVDDAPAAEALQTPVEAEDSVLEDSVSEEVTAEAAIDAKVTEEPVSSEAKTDNGLLDAKVETLPYPWSLPVPSVEQKDTDDAQPLPVDAPDSSATAAFELATEPEPARAIAQDDRPVKNGIVKLLFTLKEGNFHGYIEPDDGSKDILFHQKYINADIFPLLERGVAVTVSVKYIEGKAYATRVDLL